jgi:hypothetical protein
MKKIVSLAAALVLIASAGVFAQTASPAPSMAPAASAAPAPLGITVGTELGFGNLNNHKNPISDPASVGWGFTLDFFHSVGMLDLEFFAQADPLMIPVPGQLAASGSNTPSAIYPWFAAPLYFEMDGHFNFKLSDTATLTPEISFQSNIFQSTAASGPLAGYTTNNFPYGVFATNGALQLMVAWEPSVTLTAGPIAIKVADNITGAADAATSIVRPINELYLQPTLTLGNFSAYVRGDLQVSYGPYFSWLKWGVSEAVGSGVSLYTYGSWNMFNTAGTYSAFNYYNQALGVSIAY